MLEAEAALTGEPVGELAARVIVNADAYEVAAGRIAGIRRKVSADIDAAGTLSDVAAALDGLAQALAALNG